MERKKTKNLNAENIVLFDLACRLLSFKMYFCCTDLDRERERDRDWDTNKRQYRLFIVQFLCDTILYVSFQLTKVGKYTMLYPFHSSATQNSQTKTNNKLFLVLFSYLLSPLSVWFEIRLAQVASHAYIVYP